MIGFIFCHGWGFSSQYWENIQVYFKNYPCVFWDLGYFGTSKIELPKLEENITWIGVGHSLGFAKLISSGVQFQKLIALQGFINFLGNEPILRKLRYRNLTKMLTDFSVSPEETILTFQTACGINSDLLNLNANKQDIFNVINQENLLLDLQSLASDYTIYLQGVPCLILGSADDPIVTPRLLQDNFTSLPNSKLIILEKGKHSLGYGDAKLVAEYILNFILAS